MTWAKRIDLQFQYMAKIYQLVYRQQEMNARVAVVSSNFPIYEETLMKHLWWTFSHELFSQKCIDDQKQPPEVFYKKGLFKTPPGDCFWMIDRFLYTPHLHLT